MIKTSSELSSLIGKYSKEIEDLTKKRSEMGTGIAENLAPDLEKSFELGKINGKIDSLNSVLAELKNLSSVLASENKVKA